MDFITAALPVLAAIMLALIWFAARAAGRVHHRTIAARPAEDQEETNMQPGDPPTQLTGNNRRPGTVGAAAFVNVPNAITLVRTVAAICLGSAAVATAGTTLLVAAYLTYWAGDILDGLMARLLRQETRAGAVFDILADRACTSLCAVGLLMIRPDMAVPITVFFIQFMVVDNLLSLAFLRWPLLSPNYFYKVSPRIHRWNWSPPAKALNTGALVVLIAVTTSPVGPTVLALAVTGVKLVSLLALLRLPVPHTPDPA